MRSELVFTYMANENGDGGANTVLLVIILLIIVGAGVWWFTTRGSAPRDGINVDVNLPTNNP